MLQAATNKRAKICFKNYLDGGIGVSDGPSVVGVKEWNVLGSGLDTTDAAELVLRLLVGDSVDGEPARSGIDALTPTRAAKD